MKIYLPSMLSNFLNFFKFWGLEYISNPHLIMWRVATSNTPGVSYPPGVTPLIYILFVVDRPALTVALRYTLKATKHLFAISML